MRDREESTSSPPFGVVLCLSALAFLYNILSQSRGLARGATPSTTVMGGGCYFQYLNQISAMKDFTGMREKGLYIYGGHVQHMMGIAGRKKKYVENMAN